MLSLKSVTTKITLLLFLFFIIFIKNLDAKEIRIGLVVKGLGIGFFEAASGSALSGVYNERRVGDKGLVLGMGLVVDPNQFKGALDSLWDEEIDPYKRMITGLTFNFTYQIK